MFIGADISLLIGLVAFLAFALISTLKINRNRKDRGRNRRVAARLADWP